MPPAHVAKYHCTRASTGGCHAPGGASAAPWKGSVLLLHSVKALFPGGWSLGRVCLEAVGSGACHGPLGLWHALIMGMGERLGGAVPRMCTDMRVGDSVPVDCSSIWGGMGVAGASGCNCTPVSVPPSAATPVCHEVVVCVLGWVGGWAYEGRCPVIGGVGGRGLR